MLARQGVFSLAGRLDILCRALPLHLYLLLLVLQLLHVLVQLLKLLVQLLLLRSPNG